MSDDLFPRAGFEPNTDPIQMIHLPQEDPAARERRDLKIDLAKGIFFLMLASAALWLSVASPKTPIFIWGFAMAVIAAGLYTARSIIRLANLKVPMRTQSALGTGFFVFVVAEAILVVLALLKTYIF